jgi:hypothetical protein
MKHLEGGKGTMQVKTRITNPTDATQSYGWVPKYGIMIGAKDSIVLDGDLYTLVTVNQPRNKQAMEADEKAGRVKITLLTDSAVEKLGALAEKEVVKAPPPPPIARTPVDNKDIFASASTDEDENILGDGIQEGDINSAKGPVYDPFSGGTSEMAMPETVSMSDALWKNGGLIENAVPRTGPEDIPVLTEKETPGLPTRKDLMKMSLAALKKMAMAMGMPEVDDLKKSDIVKWILETQGNAKL